jgi:hypothetical protein
MRERIRQLLAKISAEVGLREAFVFGGLGCAAYGLAQIYPPAAWIVSGSVLFYLGIKR